MSKKTYSYKGIVELSTVIETGSGRKRITFTGGQLFPVKIDARFTTSDEEVQKAIEGKKAFREEKIFVSSVYEDAETGENESAVSPEVLEGKLNEHGFAEYPEVTKVQEARDVMYRKYGIPLSGMKNKEEVLAAAGEKKVLFPNIN